MGGGGGGSGGIRQTYILIQHLDLFKFEAGEDPGQKDEVGRTCAEAAVLYCEPDVGFVQF